MRVAIFAGLLTGVSLAVQVSLNAHNEPKVVPPDSAIRIRAVAPWYIASNDAERSLVGLSESREGTRFGLPTTVGAEAES